MEQAKKTDGTPIDFVVTWVDGSDNAWSVEKEAYAKRFSRDVQVRNTEVRYRDIGLLKYWFRSVEKFAPWVRKIHFVTCGQTPEWLNAAHPKLHLVNHSDYIPKEFLPTFNSNVIELGMHQIPGLTDHFVYFNDDMLLTAPINRDFFFKNGLPRDMYEIKAVVSFDSRDNIDMIRMNDVGVINRYFFGRKSKLQAFSKKVTPVYFPGTNIRNLYTLAWRAYLGIGDYHLAIAYRKQEFETVWALEEERLYEVYRNKFRTPFDLSHWLFRYWRLVEGRFAPINMYKFGKNFELRELDGEIIAAIRNQKYKMICLNDCMEPEQVERWAAELHGAFEAILPEKSAFER